MPPKINDGLTASQRYNRKHREKRNQQKREHRAKNHEILKQRERDLYHQNKSIIIEELGGKCVNCGTEDNLEFDHIYPQLKQSKLSHLLKQGLERIREESKLCQLLCSKCHRERTIIQRKISWQLFTSLSPETMNGLMSGEITVADLNIP